MTERSTGRNGNDRSSRLRGVLARIVSLARHYPADRSVIQAGAAVAEVPIAIGGWGGHFPQEMIVISGILATFVLTNNLKSKFIHTIFS